MYFIFRFRDIIQEAIDNKEIKSFKAFVNESKKKTAKRKAHYKKEAEEAEELQKELGLKDEGEDSLRNMILARRKDASASFLDNLAAKYGAKEKAGKTKVFKSGKASKKKAVDSDVENTPTDGEDEEVFDSDEDCSPPAKKKSMKSKNGSAIKTAAKRKVKRL